MCSFILGLIWPFGFCMLLFGVFAIFNGKTLGAVFWILSGLGILCLSFSILKKGFDKEPFKMRSAQGVLVSWGLLVLWFAVVYANQDRALVTFGVGTILLAGFIELLYTPAKPNPSQTDNPEVVRNAMAGKRSDRKCQIRTPEPEIDLFLGSRMVKYPVLQTDPGPHQFTFAIRGSVAWVHSDHESFMGFLTPDIIAHLARKGYALFRWAVPVMGVNEGKYGKAVRYENTTIERWPDWLGDDPTKHPQWNLWVEGYRNHILGGGDPAWNIEFVRNFDRFHGNQCRFEERCRLEHEKNYGRQ